MKKNLIFTLIFLTTAPLLHAQTTQATQAADPSAALEVRSKNQGFLPPRMSTFERGQIKAPAVGLTIYNTNLETLDVHTGSGVWLRLGASSSSLADLFDKDKDTGIYAEKNDQENTLRFQTNGSERMTINENGNIGIGTLNPDDALDVAGTVHFAGALKDKDGEEGTDGQLLKTTSTGIDWVTPFQLLDGDGNTSIYLSDTNTSEDIIRFKTAGGERMTIIKNGNVGIGNANPNDKLDVNGTVHFSGALKDKDGQVGTAGQLLKTTVSGIDWVTPFELLDGDKNTSIYLNGTNASEDIIRFKTAGGERMRIIKNGNVGIGNTNPNDKLDVTGTVHISGALKDSSGDTGADGQILSSTAAGTNWVNGGIQIASSLPSRTGLSNGAAFFNTSDNTLNILNNGLWNTFSRASTKEAGQVVHNDLQYNEITSAGTGEIWLDRNMGATQPPVNTVSTDSRFGNFYTWVDAQTACPTGYRLPTKAEMEAERVKFADHGGNNSNGAWGTIKITRTGLRSGTGASAGDNEGFSGYYWTSDSNATQAWFLYFHGSHADVREGNKSSGHSVRCMKDD